MVSKPVHVQDEVEDDGVDPDIIYLTPEEGREQFDRAVRKHMGISGEEFIRRWDAGEYDEIADRAGHRHIMGLAILIPSVRPDV